MMLMAGSGLAQSLDVTQPPVMPIGQALVDRDGDTIPDLIERDVHVKGVVTVPTGVVSDAYLQAFLQDDTGGIYLFDRRIEEELQIGDIVEASGQIDQYRGAVQLINSRYRIVGKTDPPEPVSLGVQAAAGWEHYGELVSVEGILGESETQSTILIPLREVEGHPEGRIDVFIPRRVDRSMLPADRPAGARVRVVGVVSIRSFDRPYHEGFQIILRDSADLAILEKPTPAWVRDLIVGAFTALGLAIVTLIVFIVHRRRVTQRERELSLVNDLSTAIASPHLDQGELLATVAKLLNA